VKIKPIPLLQTREEFFPYVKPFLSVNYTVFPEKVAHSKFLKLQNGTDTTKTCGMNAANVAKRKKVRIA